MAAPSELFCWKGGWGLPSVDPESLIVLAYARFAGAPLKIHKIANPWRSPTGSLPALKAKDEGSFSQPNKIIIQLRKQIYTLWVDPKNYVEVTRRWHADNISFPLNFFLPSRMQRQQLERVQLMRGNRTLEAGEEAEKELNHDALECMNLLSQRLGSNKFFFGDSPSSLDAYVFGHLAPLLKIKLPSSSLQQHLKSLENLDSFCCNILSLYFPNESREGVGRPVSSTQEGSEFDNEPYKRRKQLLSVLVAVAAMLSYALLTGIVAIEHVQEEVPRGGRASMRAVHEEEEEE